MIPMIEVFGAATEGALDLFEQQHQIKLPEEYRAFLKTHNGGSPDWGSIDIPGWGDSLVNVFNGLNLQGVIEENYDLATEVARFEDRFPASEVLIIADDPGGNKFLIGISSVRFGKIYFWDHEAGNCLPALVEIANSFADFIALHEN